MRRTAAGVLASTLVFSGVVAAAAPASAAASFDLKRVFGTDRYETSAAIAAEFGVTSGAILASGEPGRTVDALSANFLAGVQGEPVLLTLKNRIPAAVQARLDALTGEKRVTIVGGEAAVSLAVEAQLRASGFTVVRLGGRDRYETSELIITAGRASANSIGLVASGTSFPDALAGGPLAYKGKHPVFLVGRDTIPADTIDAMVAAGTRSVIILGGTDVVSERVRAAIEGRGISIVTRLGGANRSETSALIANYLITNQDFDATAFNVASGTNAGGGADALSGAALSGKENRALLVTETATSASAILTFAQAREATLTGVGRIFGGGTAVQMTLEQQIEVAAGAVAGPITLDAATAAQGGTITGTITGDFSSVTVSGCGFDNQTIGADDNTTTSGRQFTLNLAGAQATGDCTLTFTATPTGGGAAVTQTVVVDVTSGGLRVTPDDTVTLQSVANPDTATTDNRTYTAFGLTAGVEYRATLVLAGNITTNAQGQSVFADADNDNLADTGTVTADITQVNGAAPSNNTGAGSASTATGGTTSTVVFNAQADGTATFVVDGDQAESVRPVVYVNGGGNSDGTAGQGGTSPRLELDTNNVPTEAFDLGGVTTFTAPVVQSATVRPELQSAQILGTVTTNQVTPGNPAGTTVRYTFDENVLETGAPPRPEFFKIFNADGSQADSATVDVLDVDGASVVVRFNDIDTTAEADVLTVATVVPGAVTDPNGNTNPEGDAAIGTTTAGGGATTLAAGVTDRPDLVSVGGFRQGATVDTFAVDFVFDEAAFVANSTGFALITPGENAAEVRGTGPVAGSPAVSGTTGGTPSGGTVAGGNGTTTITVIFPGTLTAADVSRATVDLGTVSDAQQDTATAAVEGNVNPLQAVDVSNGGNTAEPDLVSAELRPSADGSTGGAVLFTFDQPVTAAAFTAGTTTTTGTTPDTAPLFQVYTDDGTVRTGTGQPVINTASDARQVLVNFADISRVVGASVGDGAVTAGTSSTNVTADVNEQDEVGVTGTTIGGTEGRTRGLTGAPDLTSVSIARGPSTTDQFGNVTQGDFQATYSFDEDVDAAVTVGGFRLYLADGTALTGTTCAVGTGAAGTTDDESFDNTVVCTDFSVVTNGTVGAATNAQLASATLGTVREDAVRDQAGATTATGGTNPDGAELSTGGTGTPTA